MPTFDIVHNQSPEGLQLLSDLRRHGFVALLGSVISDWDPSGLPPGESLTFTVAELLSEPLVSRPQIKQWIRRAAFEHVMEGCPNSEVLGDNLLELFSPARPNPVHEAVATLIADGIIEHVVTTNYDVNLEAACRAICPASRQPQVIATQREAEGIESFRPVIFKIHGCVEHDRNRGPSETRSMIYTLGKEGELPAWKRWLLYRLLAGRRLIVSGYSGRDFEICPELAALQANIIWNAREDPRQERQALTPNAQRVLTASSGMALVGDMLTILGNLAGVGPVQANRSERSTDLRDKISRGLTDWDVALWRMRTLVAMGAGTEGMRYAELIRTTSALNGDREFHTLLNLGRCQFHAGRYRQAAATYRKAAAVSTKEMRRDWLIGAKSDLVEALRCQGAWLKARKELSALETLLQPEEDWLRAAMALRSVLILRYWYQLSKGIKVVPWMVQSLRRRCRELLTMVVQHAKDGHWLELQQAELWASRLDIRFDELYKGPMNPLPSKDGYRHLGYMIAESMSLRDDLRGRLGESQKNYLARMSKDLRRAGANAELWKLILVLLRTRGWAATTATQRRAALKAWFLCEYSPTMRVFVTLWP